MKLLVEDLKTPKTAGDITELLGDAVIVTQSHWEAINAAEIAAGESLGKPRRKAVALKDLLHLAGHQSVTQNSI
jgi:ferredoxin--NADP+ reductase